MMVKCILPFSLNNTILCETMCYVHIYALIIKSMLNCKTLPSVSNLTNSRRPKLILFVTNSPQHDCFVSTFVHPYI